MKLLLRTFCVPVALFRAEAVVLLFGLLAWSLAAAPAIEHAGLVWTNILALEIRDGDVIRGRQIVYTNQPGDTFIYHDSGDSNHPQVWVRRGGATIGALSGDGRMIWLCDQVLNKMSSAAVRSLTNALLFRLWSPDDPRYATNSMPLRVWRKTRCGYLATTSDTTRDMPLRHFLYVLLPHAFVTGCTYTLSCPPGTVPSYTFYFDPRQMRSEAVHVSQAGFHLHSPVKRAFHSCWMGDGGGIPYPTGLVFHILDHTTAASVYRGTLHLVRRASEPEDPGARNRNYTGADVFAAEFPELTEPGTYRVYVEGIGCSFPFLISDTSWITTFQLMMKGFYHQRSGVALGPPYTDYVRPRCFHPEDGIKIYHSTCTLMDSGNGLNARGTDTDNFGNLNAGRTTQLVANAWGGYFDAGDWDRRIQHLRISRLLFELVDLFSNAVTEINLNIPESTNHLPDIIDEALWNLDCYRRMQTPEGGIRGGIESSAHPRFGDGSWQESLPVMAYAPDMWCSHMYAGDAARAAFILRRYDPSLAEIYSNSALRAMAYAEAQWATNFYAMTPSASNAVRDARNLAAIEMFRLTKDPAWHAVFTATTMINNDTAEPEGPTYDQADAIFTYLRTPSGTSTTLRRRYIHSLTNFARTMAQGSFHSAFGWTRHNQWLPIGWGFITGADFDYLLRAYLLSHDPYFLTATLRALQFTSGANPLNMAFTAGLGTNAIRVPLFVDSIMLGVEGPAGITTYGPLDIVEYPNNWFYVYFMAQHGYPYYTNWPVMEAYQDSYMPPDTQEYTVDRPMAVQAYAWGFLAALFPPIPEPSLSTGLVITASVVRCCGRGIR
ncbi:MAG: glycoside hydrolase family 9 protein [bacterium]|nr:glycoside hydrolase family 9 protein [bacterium]